MLIGYFPRGKNLIRGHSNGCEWMRMGGNGCEWLGMDANDSEWMGMAENVRIAVSPLVEPLATKNRIG